MPIKQEKFLSTKNVLNNKKNTIINELIINSIITYTYNYLNFMNNNKLIERYKASNIFVPRSMIGWMRSNHAGETVLFGYI